MRTTIPTIASSKKRWFIISRIGSYTKCHFTSNLESDSMQETLEWELLSVMTIWLSCIQQSHELGESLTVYFGAAVTLSWERFSKGIVSAIVIRRSWEQFTGANESLLPELIRLNYSNSDQAGVGASCALLFDVVKFNSQPTTYEEKTNNHAYCRSFTIWCGRLERERKEEKQSLDSLQPNL